MTVTVFDGQTSCARTSSTHAVTQLDATTPANGCLEIAPHPGDRVALQTAADLTLAPDVVQSLVWSPLPTMPGDLVFILGVVPLVFLTGKAALRPASVREARGQPLGISESPLYSIEAGGS